MKVLAICDNCGGEDVVNIGDEKIEKFIGRWYCCARPLKIKPLKKSEIKDV